MWQVLIFQCHIYSILVTQNCPFDIQLIDNLHIKIMLLQRNTSFNLQLQ